MKQWIYGTISSDLLQTVLSRGDKAQQVWETREVYLQNQFNNLHLSQFSDIYCSYSQKLITLKDQLANVDHAVSEQNLVCILLMDFLTLILMSTQP